MTLTVQNTDLIGAGVQFTFAAAGDELFISEGALVASTSSDAIEGVFGGHVLTVEGTVTGETRAIELQGGENTLIIGSEGSVTSNRSVGGSAGVFFDNDQGEDNGNTLINHGSISVPRAIGVLGLEVDLLNTGEITGATPVHLGLAVSSQPDRDGDSTVLNSGTILANGVGFNEAFPNERQLNGVLLENSGGKITNTETGVIAAVAPGANAIRLRSLIEAENDEGIVTINNAGELRSAAGFGINATDSVDALEVFNSGIISGLVDAIRSDTGERALIVNSGEIFGNVRLSTQDDSVSNSGEIVGNVGLGAGADIYRTTGDGHLDGIVFAGVGDDTLIGGNGDDTFQGANDDDVLRGGKGDDLLDGQTGVDTLRGGAGDDMLKGGETDADQLFGGAGNDTMEGGDGANEYSGGAGDDSMVGGDGAEVFRGGRDDDFVSAAAGNDEIFGGAGDDVLRGKQGVDTIFGGAGDDDISGGASNSDRLFGGSGDDTILGVEGNNRMNGGSGDDSIVGGTGNDTITGGKGDDTMSGGAGTDRFVFRPGDGLDVIEDFGGADRIDLRTFDFANAAAITQVSTSEGLRLDLGDGDAILLDGVTSVNNADFFF